MNLVANLQELDNLIFTLTEPPARTELRYKLSLAMEEAEAYQATSDKQDATLANQAKTIERLMEENENLIAANTPKTPDLVSHKGALFRRNAQGGYFDDVLCRKCQEPMMSFMSVHPYECAPCGIVVNFTGNELSSVMSGLPKK